MRQIPGVKWHEIAEEHKKWNKKSQGLTPAASVVVALAIGVAIGCSGAGLAVAGLFESATASATIGAMAKGGFIALASQAGVFLINNKGDIGKTFADLGKTESLESLAIGMMTAGLLEGLTEPLSLPAQPTSVVEHLHVNAVQTGVSTSLSVPLSGSDMTESLTDGVLATAINTVSGYASTKIGQARVGEIGERGGKRVLVSGGLDGFTHKLLHAVNGAALGIAVSRGKDVVGSAAAGAIGAVGAELLGEYLMEDVIGKGHEPAVLREKLQQRADMAKLAATTSTLLTGHDPAIASSAAEVAVRHNAAPSALKRAFVQERGTPLYAADMEEDDERDLSKFESRTGLSHPSRGKTLASLSREEPTHAPPLMSHGHPATAPPSSLAHRKPTFAEKIGRSSAKITPQPLTYRAEKKQPSVSSSKAKSEFSKAHSSSNPPQLRRESASPHASVGVLEKSNPEERGRLSTRSFAQTIKRSESPPPLDTLFREGESLIHEGAQSVAEFVHPVVAPVMTEVVETKSAGGRVLRGAFISPHEIKSEDMLRTTALVGAEIVPGLRGARAIIQVNEMISDLIEESANFLRTHVRREVRETTGSQWVGQYAGDLAYLGALVVNPFKAPPGVSKVGSLIGKTTTVVERKVASAVVHKVEQEVSLTAHELEVLKGQSKVKAPPSARDIGRRYDAERRAAARKAEFLESAKAAKPKPTSVTSSAPPPSAAATQRFEGVGYGVDSGFYHSHSFKESLEIQYPGRVSSTTVPQPNAKNVKFAGQRHPVSGIVFDLKGYPIFDDVAKFDTRISGDVSILKNERLHMRTATKNLRAEIIAGRIDKTQFTKYQLEDIMAGRDRISGFTWHHHQDIGRMQLILRKTHMNTGHVGGMEMWFLTQ
ncbi:MAG: HNH endonuclease [Proteobacteria bacterium]|nr:HNH endonuclease [Pseudomonadota bacterium]